MRLDFCAAAATAVDKVTFYRIAFICFLHMTSSVRSNGWMCVIFHFDARLSIPLLAMLASFLFEIANKARHLWLSAYNESLL